MSSSPVSPIEDLNAAIQSHNPFKERTIVKAQDIWGKGFPDVETLNAHASDAIFQAIERVKTSRSSQDKVTSLTFTAEKGVGKSHIISRIRHRLERDGGALFVYASADEYVDLDLIKYQFQQTLADSLKHTGSQGVMQWQEVATAMANEASKASNSNAPTLAPEQLVKRFDQVYDKRIAEKKKNLMEELVEKVLKSKPNSDPDIVRAILWTLSEKQAPYAINWLSGKELAKFKAEELRLPSISHNNNQDREVAAFNTVRPILNLVSNYNPVLICFDEIDVLNDCDEAGNQTPEVIADLVKRLYDTLRQSEQSQGIVILTVMMPDTWSKTVKQLSGGIPDRVAATGKPLALKHMDGNSIIELVKCWLKDFYEEQGLTPHDPLYPFPKERLIELGQEKLPVRNVLRWCAENFKVEVEPLPEDPPERFDFAVEKESEVDISNYLEDNSLIADVLFFGFDTLKGQTLEGVTIEDVTKRFGKRGGRDRYVNFKITGREDGKAVKIGIAVLQDSNGMAFQAGLKRLMEYQSLDITRGCLVRSKDKKVYTSWKKSGDYLNQLTSELGGEFVELIEEQIRPLFVIHSVYQKRDKYSLSEEQVFEFISQKQITFDNPLLHEILSDPSGQLPDVEDDIFIDLAGATPDNAAKDETTIYDEFTSLSSTDNTTDEDGMSDLFN